MKTSGGSSQNFYAHLGKYIQSKVLHERQKFARIYTLVENVLS